MSKRFYTNNDLQIYAKRLLDAVERTDTKNIMKYGRLWAEAKAYLESKKNDFLPFPDEDVYP